MSETDSAAVLITVIVIAVCVVYWRQILAIVGAVLTIILCCGVYHIVTTFLR
jgi:hypothetical protein